MDGIHDLGGMHGFGAIRPLAAEPVFHAAWERRAFGLASAVPAVIGMSDDVSRRNIERMDPRHYLASPYYEKWIVALIDRLRELGVLTDDDLAAGRAVSPLPAGVSLAPALSADQAWPAFREGASQALPTGGGPARFAVGDRVRTAPAMPEGHTRLPRYVRDKVGTIAADHGVFIFADAHAARGEPEPQRLYAVVFQATDLWGAEARPGDTVSLDLFDPYLMAAP